ncbi:nitroreductase/quinone reductase family protein [Streptomyces sp. NPDC093094]|uniref:nitroreductase/quinone reductase family protein n=1 Tax=Streptomyces sp. NPDC093094 TaxID=3366026 RepID=UPI0038032DA0
MPDDFNQQVIEEFRAHHGKVGGFLEGARLLLLTTRGARSGRPRTVPLGYLPDGGERVLVIASAAGAPRHPAWYHNLLAHPEVTVEDGVFTYRARAVPLAGQERDRAFARAVEADPGWAEYQSRTDRILPVVALHALPAEGPPNVNAGSMAEGLKVIHDAFRRELALLRSEMSASGPGLGAQLRANCLTFCHGLHNHHTGEGLGLLPAVEARHPQAAQAVARLHAEHEKIAALVEELRAAIDGGDAAVARAEVERLTFELEAHLAYEEEQLIPLLDV